MDFFGTKEIAILLGLVVLLAFLIDGVRRMLAARADRIRMDRLMSNSFDGDDEDYGSELPNGGARVVRREPGFEDDIDYFEEPEPGVEPAVESPQQGALDLSDPVPMLMDPVDLGEQELQVKSVASEEDEFINEPLPQGDDYIVINLMAPEGHGYLVEDLVDSLKRVNMKIGAMQFYHRRDREKNILFSAANIVKPGALVVEDQATVSPGLSFFMTLPCKSGAMDCFESMLAAASEIAEHLGGELKDEQRITMTAQVLEHCRTRIAEYERKKKLSKADA